ncbi:hypothetical protein TSAR_011619 [Trichomalopsis sarcophagae]|uniref:Uncharacterized protein n=1 Tax=Trichomalopsis sarcophagae TaxID=543379 RepID=A0A232EGX5_9HYME|nr:hypothetical protein TSAR_011619 [Trichomalopsis sarcophagae]
MCELPPIIVSVKIYYGLDPAYIRIMRPPLKIAKNVLFVLSQILSILQKKKLSFIKVCNGKDIVLKEV